MFLVKVEFCKIKEECLHHKELGSLMSREGICSQSDAKVTLYTRLTSWQMKKSVQSRLPWKIQDTEHLEHIC